MAEILEPSSRKRKLAAILHADVVGFSRLMGVDEAGTHRALGELRGAVDPLIAAHGGRIVGTAGDSLLADFSSVVDAMASTSPLGSKRSPDPVPSAFRRRSTSRSGTSSISITVHSAAIASRTSPNLFVLTR
jgi:class 3 adenylate cyclase